MGEASRRARLRSRMRAGTPDAGRRGRRDVASGADDVEENGAGPVSLSVDECERACAPRWTLVRLCVMWCEAISFFSRSLSLQPSRGEFDAFVRGALHFPEQGGKLVPG